MTLAFAIGLIAHGLVHLAVWVARPDPNRPAPFDPGHSWALSQRGVDAAVSRDISARLATTIAATFTAAGILLVAGSGVWAPVALVAAVAGLALKIGWFNPWLSAGIAIDLAVTVAALSG